MLRTLLAGVVGALILTAPAAHAATITEFDEGIDPLGSPGSISPGPDGNLYFIEDGAKRIAQITVAGEVTEFPALGPGFRRGLTLGPDGNLWFTESFPGAIGRFTAAGAFT